MKLLKDKTSIITGSNSGIGLSILHKFSENSSTIFACYRNMNKDFEKTVKVLMEKNDTVIYPIKLDLESEDSIKTAFKEIGDKTSTVDNLINNAGIIENSIFQMTSKKNLSRMFNVNFINTFLFTQLIIKKMIKNKSGNIVNISSTSAIEANYGRFSYSTSKAALITGSKILAKELGKFNIRVNTVSPGLIDTKMLIENTTNENINKTLKRVILKRKGTPEEVANVVLFLSSKLSNYITGQNIRVDGGLNNEEI